MPVKLLLHDRADPHRRWVCPVEFQIGRPQPQYETRLVRRSRIFVNEGQFGQASLGEASRHGQIGRRSGGGEPAQRAQRRPRRRSMPAFGEQRLLDGRQVASPLYGQGFLDLARKVDAP